MNDSILPKIMTVDEVADYLRISTDVILKELERGRLRGFKIGEEWRLTETNMMDFITRNHHSASIEQLSNLAPQYEATGFAEIGPFDYQWPTTKEHYEGGYETTRNINGRTHTFKIGFTSREAAGLTRRKIVVWIDNWPVVEFTAGNNYESDGLLAGIIKITGGKQLRPTGKVPEEYKDFRVAKYDSIVQGPYASRNMAVIVQKDDLESMIRHAVIRATWKELI
jgi:excisionase family DNA binding protein